MGGIVASRWLTSRWKLPVLSGALFALAYIPSLGFAGSGTFLLPFHFMGLVPLLAWLDSGGSRPRIERFRGAFLFGLCLYAIALHWIYAMLRISWLAAVMYVGVACAFSLCIMGALSLAGWVRRRTGGSFAWVLPVCWLPWEWARSWGDLRMTADHVGHSLADHPFLVQCADLVGPYGVGALVLGTNGLLYEAVRFRSTRRGFRAAVTLLALWTAVIAYDGWAWTHPPRAVRMLRVGFVQPNIPLDVKHDEAADTAIWDVLSTMTRRAAADGARLVVWPETARPKPLEHYLAWPQTFAMPDVQALARDTGTAILAGVEYLRIRGEESTLHNAALVARPDGGLEDAWAAKIYLVPFVERTPFLTVFGSVLSGSGPTMRWLSGRFDPGPPNALLPVLGERVGTLVCYEELYPDLARGLRNAGAGLMVVITNDAWFGRTFFQQYQADVLRMRAIESRTAFVRAANTGISGFVDPRGRYHAPTPLFVPATAVWDLPVTSYRTVYDRTGDVVAWVAVAGLAVVVTVLALRRGRPSPAMPSASDPGSEDGP